MFTKVLTVCLVAVFGVQSALGSCGFPNGTDTTLHFFDCGAPGANFTLKNKVRTLTVFRRHGPLHELGAAEERPDRLSGGPGPADRHHGDGE